MPTVPATNITVKWKELLDGKECAWGTVVQCRFPLGRQRLTEFEISQTVDRLTKKKPKNVKQWWAESFKHGVKSPDEIEGIVKRLRTNGSEKASDSQRIAKGPIKNMGVVNSFAWKGYN